VISIATSGYSYKDWVGPFYPPKQPAGTMLEYYSRHFQFTEINSTYYHMPSLRNYIRLPERTPESFCFSVKAHGSMTHERTATAADCRDFLAALAPLGEAQKLICVLAQFPYSFNNTTENRDYLLRLAEWLQGPRLAVEFRRDSWITGDTFSWLKENGLYYVSVDSPALRGLPARHAVSTGDMAYVRFHGRNAEKWWQHEQSYQRYDYLYSEDELQGWVAPLRALEAASGEVFVCFNNHFIGQAVGNARMLARMLGR
jgi:uncharacterized protein YecE (DUF72 family)